ncbi:MAG: DNA mismatch repair protein MutS [Tissierellia bacterium]|nr:DNA mismatch repair protein MutS [Tissierellia bacterium]
MDKKSAMKTRTPMMEQYFRIKERFPDHILLFRLGDFYEMFYEDALQASKALEIALTKRDAGNGEKAPMCGIPHHVSDNYITKLVERGFKAAICEQLEDPRQAKGIVKRDVIRVVTPGTNLEMSSPKPDNNYLMSVFVDRGTIGISYGDITTGELVCTQREELQHSVLDALEEQILSLRPTELLVSFSDPLQELDLTELGERLNVMITHYKDAPRGVKESRVILEKNLRTRDYESILKERYSCAIATAMLLSYIYQYQKTPLKHMDSLVYIDHREYLEIEAQGKFHLELLQSYSGKKDKNTLLGVLNHTKTAMGSRLLTHWIEKPLLEMEEIQRRLNSVEALVEDGPLLDRLRELLDGIYDIERILGKLSFERANGRDLISLKYSIENLGELRSRLQSSDSKDLCLLSDSVDPLEDIYQLIESGIVEDPPIGIREGGLIKEGFDGELDRLRGSSVTGKRLLLEYEQQEREKTGIKSMKIVFNKKTGYFLDVTKSNLGLVPSEYDRIQTLTNSERFMTSRLREIEHMILSSEADTMRLEEELFGRIRDGILDAIARLQMVCRCLARLDTIGSLAYVAKHNGYRRPQFNQERRIQIQQGRHPVIEQVLDEGQYIANDAQLGEEGNIIQLITGPNMSGKSTYLRQIALTVIMAQMGSFVPAAACDLCLVDRIFTRIGASDNLAKGDSTFMVEMKEVSHILRNATRDSLILLDEVGRGTSTYDGLSLAWAIVEYLSEQVEGKTLFATHYHELTRLDARLSNVRNLQVAVEEEDRQVIFLHKIVPGSANKSFGIEVARIAGLPKKVLERAKTVLKTIEVTNSFEINEEKLDSVQIDFSTYQKDAFIQKISSIDANYLSPLDALNLINDLASEAKIIGLDEHEN